MSFRTPGAPTARMPRRSRLLAPVAAVVVVIIAAIMLVANYVTDYMWYSSAGYQSVFVTELTTRVTMFAIGGLLMAAVVGVNIYFAYRTRPAFRPFSLEQQGLDRYRSSIDPHRKLFYWGIVAGLGLLTGASASGDWQRYLMYANATDFGVADPQFGMDLSFFAFTYPFLRVVLGYLFAAVILGFLAALVTHYLYGGVRLQTQNQTAVNQRTSAAARVHLSVLLGVFMLLQAIRYYLERFEINFSEAGYTFGASYTDVQAVLPARTFLMYVAVLSAVLFFANIYFRNAIVPVASVGLMVLSAVLAGMILPAIVQQFSVSPNEQQYEEPYIQRNIENTRYAYGIDDDSVEVVDYDAEVTLTPEQLVEEAETIPSVRLIDPSVVSQTFQQTQQVRGFYQFPEILDVDRYETPDGQRVDTIVAARELDGPPEGQDNWLTRHLIYTHGYGLVAAAGNQIDRDGRPVFTEYNIPPRGELSETTGEYEPRIYYGREGANYVVVNAHPEYDRPGDSGDADITTSEDVEEDPSLTGEGTNDDEATEDEDADDARAPASAEGTQRADADEDATEDTDADATDEATEEDADAATEDEAQATQADPQDYRYSGAGGVELSTFFHRILYALEFGEANFLLNQDITNDSRVIYHRDPSERVERVAPFLTVDGNPYPAVVDGNLVWIVDAYTTSDRIPYSTPIDLDAATQDVFTEQTQTVDALPANRINYIRNSVKATVDAYDGTITLYGWDEDDPVLQTWMEAFPGIVTSSEDISEDLSDHLRYPDDLFKVQREKLREYHITDAAAFYGGQDFWNVPTNPTTDAEIPEPPYRQTLRFPDDDEASFSLTSTFVPRARENLAAFMAVDSEPASENYGTIRILQLPQDTAIRGPRQMQNEFEADADVRDVLLPLQQGSDVTFGNLLTLPFAGGLLYVEPVYVQAEGGGQSSYPLLQQVLVGFGEDVGVGSNLQEALNNLFEEGDGPLEDAVTDDEATEDDEAAEEGVDETVQDALADAAAAYDDGEEALADGDFAAYGDAMSRLQEALERAAELSDGE